ncbi:glycerate kinase [uncultured Campylobacter sp.]|uniref:glycerate kinase family protein n=1 Tax=uncultured Campylobacter sp. TaxID=218934 RepID=UPI003211AA57
MADGGEGTTAALVAARGGEWREVLVQGPLARPVTARYGRLPDGSAVMEMAEAAGLHLLAPAERNPRLTSTFGVGEMLRHALADGARHIILGIGGSATNDGGAGMLQALGVRLLDEKGSELPRGGAALSRLARADFSALLPDLRDCTLQVACDVNNPLCGERGASAIFGPQKGADEQMVKDLDAGLISFASATSEHFSSEFWNFKGAGAAGGLGYGFVSYLNAKLKPGIDIIMEEIRLEEDVKNADLIITGEGRLDFQSSMGKTPTGVAKIAKKYGKPIIALAGSVSPCAGGCNENGIDAFFSVLNEPVSLEEAMDKQTATRNLKMTAQQALRLYLLGRKG